MNSLEFTLENQEFLLKDSIDKILAFRKQKYYKVTADSDYLKNTIVEDLPITSSNYNEVYNEFYDKIMQYCVNDTSANSMGFPDSGNNVAGLIGTLYSEFLHQNLINQLGSAPSATFAEITVVRWIREIVGYTNCDKKELNSVLDVGGILNFGGTMSNTIAMMLARSNHDPNVIKNGIADSKKFKVIVPKGIEHYSIDASLKWIGLGENILFVKTNNFKIDKVDLKRILKENRNEIMACVVYAGDSKTMTIDDLGDIYDIVKSFDENIWMHCDACHGFSLGFSDKLKYKIKGIEKYDSITTDAHKVLMVPYGLSILLAKDPKKFGLISVDSDLILQSQNFAYGQITPFIGSKNASCFKLWFLLKAEGKKHIGEIIEKRHYMAKYFANKIKNNSNFMLLNDTVINSVMFFLIPKNTSRKNIQRISDFNKQIFALMNEEGKYYLHSFPIVINNKYLRYDKLVTPLRFMSGNPYLNEKDIDNLIEYLLEKI